MIILYTVFVASLGLQPCLKNECLASSYTNLCVQYTTFTESYAYLIAK